MPLLKLSLKLGLFSAIFLQNPSKRAGGEGRNRPSLVFHKPLEINRLWHRLLFYYKGVALIVNPYPAISFSIGFSSFKAVRAGTFAGTF